MRRPDEAKSRLAGDLPTALRRELVRAMLDDVLAAARSAHDGPLYVATPDVGYADVALRHGAQLIIDDGAGFNAAVRAALARPEIVGRAAVLVLPADLPQLTADDAALVLTELALPDVEVVLVPSADGGTAALGLHPPSRIEPMFGPWSAAAHRREAQRSGARLREMQPASLAADIDTPADLIAVRDRVGPATRALLPRLPAEWSVAEQAR